MYLLVSRGPAYYGPTLPIIGGTGIDWFTNDDLAQWDPGVRVHLQNGSRWPIGPRAEDQRLDVSIASMYYRIYSPDNPHKPHDPDYRIACYRNRSHHPPAYEQRHRLHLDNSVHS